MMIFNNNKYNNLLGFTLIEILIVIAIIGVLAAIAAPTFISYRQKTFIASCLATSHSIQASLISYAATNERGSFPQPQQLSTWGKVVQLCNMNGSSLTESPEQIGFRNWVSYTPIDLNGDNFYEEFYLLLRLNGVERSIMGSQIEINHQAITKQTF